MDTRRTEGCLTLDTDARPTLPRREIPRQERIGAGPLASDAAIPWITAPPMYTGTGRLLFFEAAVAIRANAGRRRGQREVKSLTGSKLLSLPWVSVGG